MSNDGRELKAKPIEWGLFESKEGKVSVFVKLATSTETFTWWGSLASPASQAITAKALVTMGFADEDLQHLQEEDALNPNQFVSIIVAVEEYKGEMKERVKWINPLRKPREKVVLKGIDLKQLFAQEFKARDVKLKQRQSKQVPVDNSFDTSDIPF